MIAIKKRLIIYTIIFFILTLSANLLINSVFQERKNQYLDAQTELLERTYKTNYRYFKIMSQDIFTLYSENKKLIELFSQAHSANKETQSEIRNKMYKMLESRYKKLVKMGVKQLHFHLPDNTSFLRMHKKNKFGDDLTNIRYSIAQTNKNKIYTEGFEAAKVVHGFRFVYPLFDIKKEIHIGSVEISFSSEPIIENLKQEKIGHLHLLVLKNIINKKTWENDKNTFYVPSWFSDEWLVEKTIHFEQGPLCETIQNIALAKEISDNLQNNAPFSLAVHTKETSITLSFLPIKNVKGMTAAYLVNYKQAPYLTSLHSEMNYFKTLMFSIMLILSIFGFYIIITKHKLELLAHFDTLTNLPNRRYFYAKIAEEVARSHRYKKMFALLFIDLDGFKEVNDSYNHSMGDALLKEVGIRLTNTVRSTDFVARLGGDEFTVILTELNSKDEAVTIANKIIAVLNKEFVIHKQLLHIGASIGISLYPNNADSVDALIHIADEMMYEAKNCGKNKAILYESEPTHV